MYPAAFDIDNILSVASVDSKGVMPNFVIETKDAAGETWHYSYSRSERNTTITNNDNKKWTYWFDAAMYTIRVQDPEGRLSYTEYTFQDSNTYYGDIKATIDRNGNRIDHDVDLATGNVTKIVYPDKGAKTYADDCLILVKSEKAANRVMASITKFFEDELGLKVNVTKSKVDRPNGIKFLGFGFYYDLFSHQFKAKPHQVSIPKLKYKLKQLTSRRWGVSTSYRLLKLKQLIIGWVNYFRIGQMKSICIKLDAHIRFRLRMCIWKQWKKVKTRYMNLQKLGISKGKAWEWANTRKGYARVARSFILCRAITNERLKKFGLVSLLDQYQSVHI